MKENKEDDLSFNLLPEEERLELMFKHTYNPYDLPDGIITYNPYSGDALQYNKGGDPTKPTHLNEVIIMRNPFSSKIIGKILYENGDAIKRWDVSEDNEWVEDKEFNK